MPSLAETPSLCVVIHGPLSTINFFPPRSVLRLRWVSEVAQSCPILCDPMDCSLTRFLCPWDSPGENTRVGFHFLLQENFPTQGSNPGLPHCRHPLYPLSHQGRSVLTFPPLNSDCPSCLGSYRIHPLYGEVVSSQKARTMLYTSFGPSQHIRKAKFTQDFPWVFVR